MKFELRPLTEAEYPIWDAFVDESPRGTLFHKSFWLDGSGYRFVIYGYFRGGELFAGIPLVYRQILGMKLASRFMTMYSGILFKEQAGKYVNRLSAEKEASQILARRVKSDFHVARLGFSPGLVDLQPFIWEGFSPGVQYTYIMQLNKSLEELWMGMEETTRTSVRKAEKDGITVTRNDDFTQTFNLVENAFTRQGMKAPPKSLTFVYNKMLTEKRLCRTFIAKDNNGKHLAAIYIVWDNKRGYYLHGGHDSDKRHYGASSLAMWEAIKYVKEELGLSEFDFDGSMVPSIERFFRGFGGQINVRFGAMWVKPYLKIALLFKAVKS